MVVSLKAFIVYKQIKDLKRLRHLIRKPFLMTLYVINIMLFIAMTIEGVADTEKCNANAELIVIFFYTSLTLIQPLIMSFFLKQVLDMIKVSKKKSMKWHLDFHANVHQILNRIPDDIVHEIENSRSYEVWSQLPKLKIPFNDQWNLMKTLTSYHNSMD